MRGNPKSWRHSAQSPESRKLEMMRRAKTSAENRYGLGGLEKGKHKQPKPVTLPKMPWDEKPESRSDEPLSHSRRDAAE